MEVIFNPIYKGISYKNHRCSNCKSEIDLGDEYSTYKETYKYCPYCGEEIIRYGKPIYEELPNWDWLEEYKDIIDNVYKKLEYIIHCKKTETERSELIEKTEFGEKYFGRDWYPISNGNICSAINYIARQKIHYSEKNRLEKEFKGE